MSIIEEFTKRPPTTSIEATLRRGTGLVASSDFYEKLGNVVGGAVDLLFLPSCSPEIKFDERLRKFVKKRCLYNTYYKTFEDFKNGINGCLE
ncbi:MAG: hypothetical protein LBU65_10025 [Planctomycetaceae bacterium]|jgi:hypothetical protein|nr:hypothetical protein [Planctomycetaceae bacterium]